MGGGKNHGRGRDPEGSKVVLPLAGFRWGPRWGKSKKKERWAGEGERRRHATREAEGQVVEKRKRKEEDVNVWEKE